MINNIKTALDAMSCQTERGLGFLDVINIVSGKWKLVLICIIQNRQMRFNEIHKQIPGISPRMLSKELKDLELNGVIQRTVLDSRPVTIVYSLTDSAKDLVPIVMNMVAWGVSHRTKSIVRS
ncbi:winged helix-turn-helix transcriptional regulator [Pedobacter antarcticus]|uniref:winged helix-turn-helix transcriptional regulator n=1 Tax=Pedobacter antarcticus TaxID=34086 RepID=UPI001C576A6C|nr:helix-turn-helix domain-containing protein [Pedobacter antarcticus]